MAYDFEKERKEAIDAGQRALISLRKAERHLDSAAGWGLWDMFGGGMVTSVIKHSKMDKAKKDMERARYDLNSFCRELRDVNAQCDIDIRTGDFLSFADIFMDGFFADWMMQDRIGKSRRQVREAIRGVEGVLRELQNY